MRNRLSLKHVHRNNLVESLCTEGMRIFILAGGSGESWSLGFKITHHKGQTLLIQDKQKPSWCWTTVKMIHYNDKNQAWLMSLGLRSKLMQLRYDMRYDEAINGWKLPVVMYRCKGWTIKQLEPQIIDAFELCHWWRLLKVPWTPKRNKPVHPEGNQL